MPGSEVVMLFLPPPCFLIRSAVFALGCRCLNRTSLTPWAIVLRARPVASETADTPPQPIAVASVAAHCRRERSSNRESSALYFLRICSTSSLCRKMGQYQLPQRYQLKLLILLFHRSLTAVTTGHHCDYDIWRPTSLAISTSHSSPIPSARLARAFHSRQVSSVIDLRCGLKS